MDIATLVIGVDSRSVTDATRVMDGMSSAGDRLTGIVKGLVAAWASWKVIEYAREAALLAGRYETLGVVMGVVGNNAGYTRQQMETYAASLQKAGISMVESRNSLTVMAQSHIDLAKAQQLGRLAQDAAVVGNMNSSEAFKVMIHGIQSGQTETLRTIGINVNFEESYKKLAESLHKNTKDLTEYEKTQARTNAVLGKAADLNGAYEASMGTAGKQLLSMTRYAEDLQTVFGSLFSGAFETVVQALNQALQDMKKWLTDNSDAVRTMNAMLTIAGQNFVGLVKDVFSLASNMGQVNDQLSTGEYLTGMIATTMAVARDLVMGVVGAIQMLWGGIEIMIYTFIRTAAQALQWLFHIKPPAWIENGLQGGAQRMADGWGNFQMKNTTALFDTGDLGAFAAAESKKADATQKAEKDRIAAGNKTRADQELAAATKLREEAAKALGEAIKEQNQALERERILLDQGAVSAYAYDLAKAGISGKAREDLVLKRMLLDYDKAHADFVKEDLAAQQKYRDEVYKLADAGPQQIGKLPSQVSAERYAAQLNQKDDYPTQMARLNDAMATGELTMESYKKRQHELLLGSQTVWGAMAYSVENFADRGAEALASFLNGTKTGFRDMVASVLLDMEKLILKQQVIAPFLSAMTGMNWGSLFGGGGSGISFGGASAVADVGSNPFGMMSFAVGTDYVPRDMVAQIHQGERIIPAAQNRAGAIGGTTITNQVNVTVSDSGASTSVKSSGANGQAIGDSLKGLMTQWALEQQRPGGVLNPA